MKKYAKHATRILMEQNGWNNATNAIKTSVDKQEYLQ